MLAKYRTTCPHCQLPIGVGSEIAKRNGKWGHEVCPAYTRPTSSSRAVDKATVSLSETPPVLPALSTAPGELEDIFSLMAESDDAPAVAPRAFTPSAYQQAIFDFIKNETGNAVVEAVAGSGKTTTIVEALKYMPRDAKVAFIAFNRHIAKEIGERTQAQGLTHVHVSTLHSLGFSNLKDAFGKLDVDDRERRDFLYAPFACLRLMERRDPNYSRAAQSLIHARRGAFAKLLALTRATLTDANDSNAIAAMVEHFNIEMNGDAEQLLAILPEALDRCATISGQCIDYDDMVDLPVRLNLPLRKLDVILVDEAQDLTVSNTQFILRSLAPGGRIIAVGDRRQSLYGFRGADTQAIPNLIAALGATILPLSICYRCPSSHVKLAQSIVPQIEAREGAPEGMIETIDLPRAVAMGSDGDMLICRVNAPLVAVCFEFLRSGRKATIRGKDIGKDLSTLAQRLADNCLTISVFVENCMTYQMREVDRLEAKKASATQVESLRDRVSTLIEIAGNCNTPADIPTRIESLFSDEVQGIVLSSVHRAKGLESNRVFILLPELMPFPKAEQEWEIEQEYNCKYVALTRSKSELYFVPGEKKERN